MKKIIFAIVFLCLTFPVLAQSENWDLKYTIERNEFNDEVGRIPYLMSNKTMKGKDASNATVSVVFFFSVSRGIGMLLERPDERIEDVVWDQLSIRDDKTGKVYHPKPYDTVDNFSYYTGDEFKLLVPLFEQGYFTISVRSSIPDYYNTYGNSVVKITTQTQGFARAIHNSKMLDR